MKKCESSPCNAGLSGAKESHPPLLHSVPEARRLLGGMGHTWFYAQVKAGRIRIVKLGARTLVPDSELNRFVFEAVRVQGGEE